MLVLNLIITGIPSIHNGIINWSMVATVLNLIITGIPSIQSIGRAYANAEYWSFKPYYNWNTFNTLWR